VTATRTERDEDRAVVWTGAAVGVVGGLLVSPLIERTGTIGGIARASLIAAGVGIAIRLARSWVLRRTGRPRPVVRATRWEGPLSGAVALAWALLVVVQLVSGDERLDRADLVFAGLVEIGLVASFARERSRARSNVTEEPKPGRGAVMPPDRVIAWIPQLAQWKGAALAIAGLAGLVNERFVLGGLLVGAGAVLFAWGWSMRQRPRRGDDA
jgi:hypothetical protein